MLVSSLDRLGMMWGVREKSIIRWPKTVHYDGRRVRTLRVKLLWRTELGIVVILGLISGIEIVVIVGDISE